MPPDPAAPACEIRVPGASRCSHVQFAGFGEHDSREKSRSCCFLHVNEHKTYACNSVDQTCSSLEETGAFGMFWSCFLTHVTIYCLTRPEQQPHFHKDKVQGKSLSLQLLLQNVLKAQNAPEHLPGPFSPDLPIVPLIKARGITRQTCKIKGQVWYNSTHTKTGE